MTTLEDAARIAGACSVARTRPAMGIEECRNCARLPASETPTDGWTSENA